MSLQTATRPTTPAVRARVEELVRYIQQGRVLEAMDEFYSPDVKMSENANPPTIGLAANIEREKQFLSQVKQWKGFTATAVAVDEARGVSFIENVIEFVHTSGADVRMEQVSVARWRDGRIVAERFYYDSAKK